MVKGTEVFVRTSLRNLVFDCDSDILDVYYLEQNGEEFVVILYMSSEPKKINITGNNFKGIAKKVIAEI